MSKDNFHSSLASSWGMGRIVLLSLGVLGLGMAIAFAGYFLTR